MSNTTRDTPTGTTGTSEAGKAEAASACCVPGEQANCCEPAAKRSCCGSEAAAGGSAPVTCGCQG